MAVISTQIKPLRRFFKVHRHPCLNALRVAGDISPKVPLWAWDHQGNGCSSFLSLGSSVFLCIFLNCTSSHWEEWGLLKNWCVWDLKGRVNVGVFPAIRAETRVRPIGTAGPQARLQLQPNLMMVCERVLAPTLHTIKKKTPIKLHYAAAVMGFRKVFWELTKVGVSLNPSGNFLIKNSAL